MPIAMANASCNRRPAPRLSELELCAWVAQAVPGDRLEYHRGFLALDTFALFTQLDDRERAELGKLASRAFWAAERGLVHLVQERTGPDQFAYIAVARPKPKAAAVSLSALLLAEPEAA
jgi:hypothetical protein